MKTTLLRQIRKEQMISPEIYRFFLPLQRFQRILTEWNRVYPTLKYLRKLYRPIKVTRRMVNEIIAYDMNLKKS